MILLAIAGFFGVCSLLALRNWRYGVLACLVVGFLQDPLRKVLPGQPVYALMLVIAIFGVTVLSYFLARGKLRFSHLFGRDRFLEQTAVVFFALVILQVAHSLVRFGNPIISGLGLLTYFAPALAVLLGHEFARNEKSVRLFMSVYLALSIPFVLTVYLSYYYSDRWDVLKEVGELAGQRLLIFDQGTVLYSYSGLFRVGEVAAWHAATACMFLVVMATVKRYGWFRVLAGVLIVVLMGALILTGRRKMLMAFTLFLGTYGFLMATVWKRTARTAGALLTIGIGVSLAIFLGVLGGVEPEYAARGASVFDEGSERLSTSYGLFWSAYNRVGFFGAGAGVSAQGSQYFGGGAHILGGSAEAGTGKILAELGIPGLLAAILLVIALGLHFQRLALAIPGRYRSLSIMTAAFAAAALANGAIFLVATQLFGDTLILIMLGFLTGFVLAFGRIARQYKARELSRYHAGEFIRVEKSATA